MVRDPRSSGAIPVRVDYFHRDGFDAGFVHARLEYAARARTIKLIGGDDPRARSEYDSYLFLRPLLYEPCLEVNQW